MLLRRGKLCHGSWLGNHHSRCQPALCSLNLSQPLSTSPSLYIIIVSIHLYAEDNIIYLLYTNYNTVNLRAPGFTVLSEEVLSLLQILLNNKQIRDIVRILKLNYSSSNY